MKKKIFLSLIGLFLSLILSAHTFSLTLYDDFSGIYIDRTKWVYGEFVREINGGKLIFKHASPNPIAISSYPFYEFNMLSFSDPNSVVNSLQADVTILENNITNQAVTMARLAGAWYNDGTPGGGRIGDIVGVIHLRGDSTGLFAAWVVLKMTNVNGSTNSIFGSGKFTTPIILGTAYTLYIAYDVATNQFTFKVGTEEKTFGPGGLPTRVGNANSPGKDLGTRVDVYDSTSSSYISATFDNVYKNGALYDDFSSSTIDPTKWATYEFVREISNGKLRTKVRTSSASNNEVNNELPSIVPIKAVQAKVTLLDYQNPPGPYFRVGVAVKVGGAFYNDGTPGEWQIGDVQANVRIIANESATLQPDWEVFRCADSECDTQETLANGIFTTPIVLGNTYTLFMEWDGSQFTLKFNDEVAHYTPTSSSINAAKLPLIVLTTEVNATPGHNKEATIEALYDEVMINARVVAADFDRDGKTDIFWRHATSGQTAIWMMNGATITSIGTPGTVSDTNWQVKGIGDFNGDGKSDILWQNSTSGWTAIWFMNGATITSIGSPGAVSDSNWKIQGIGDFNGDGKADVLWRHATSGQVAIWFMNGSTITSIGAPGTVSDLNWQIKGIGDFNGDGKADVLWRHATSGQTAIWMMNGSTISSIGAPGTVSDLNWQIKGIGDFNGDGKSEILWQNATSGWTVVWFMNGAIVSSSQTPGVVSDTNWEIKSIGDFNGDGKADVLWRHTTSGQTAIWLMSGSTVTDVGAPGTVSDLNWQIAN